MEVGRSRRLVATAGFALLGLGVVTSSHAAVALASLYLVSAAVGYVSQPPEVALHVDREIEDTSPSPGQNVRVTLEIENLSDERLPELRAEDSPPGQVSVVEGRTGLATSVEPRGRVEYTYTLAVPRGEMEFGAVDITVFGASGAWRRDSSVRPDGDASIDCGSRPDGLPLQPSTRGSTGCLDVDVGGEGVEFHSTREYRRGDPVSRIDWRAYARTGTPSTVSYRTENKATVAVLVDDRRDAHRSLSDDARNTVDLTRYAAERCLVAATRTGNPTCLLSIGGSWIPPGTTSAFVERARRVVSSIEPHATSVDVSTVPPHVEARLPAGSHVVYVAPRMDGEVEGLTSSLVARGHPVTVLSPDPTSRATEVTPGVAVERVERRYHARRTRSSGASVVDWDVRRPIDLGLRRLEARGRL